MVRLVGPDPSDDLLTRHAPGEQHDLGPLDLSCQRALAPRSPLQLPPIGLGNLYGAHPSGDDNGQRGPGTTSRTAATEHWAG